MSFYRADIDGLRALAVLAVILYHALPRLAPGGYVGVDVFFVISGFLITGIICADLADARFGFVAFYARRVRRLAPALLLVVAACLAYGFVVLLPEEMNSLGQQAAGAAFFMANLLFWHQSGYFDQTAAAKPLLHLWSLGVEEQFYLIWPLALWILWRVRTTRQRWVMVASVASFAFNVVQSRIDPTADFYSPIGRLWEFGAGALVAIGGGPVRMPARGAAACFGICLIFTAIFAFGVTTSFPGWRALLPMAGAALVIGAGPLAWVNRAVLASRPAVFLGRISYPLYLWHWPLLSFATILRLGRHPTPLMAGLLLIGCVILAWLTARFVEAPLRSSAAPGRTARRLVVGMAAMGMAGAAAWLTHGFAARFADLPGIDIARINAAVGDGIFQSTPAMSVRQIGLVTVSFIPANAPNAAGDAILLTGDSLLYQYAPRIEALYRARRLRHPVYFVAGPSCSPVPGVLKAGMFAACRTMPGVIADTLAGRAVGTVVMGGYWAGSFDAATRIERGAILPIDTPAGKAALAANLRDDVAAMIRNGHRVVLILSPPVSGRFDPRYMVARSLTGFAIRAGVLDPVAQAGLRAATAESDGLLLTVAHATGAATVDPFGDICGAGAGCSPFFAGVEPKFADDKHLRPVFVRDGIRFLDPFLVSK